MMRPRRTPPTAALALCLSTASTLAADVTATSRIEAITVFPSGAEITRIAKVPLVPGEHTLIFADLPAQAVASSIRVEGKATGRLDIGSVDTRRLRLQRADSAAVASERKAIEDEIERTRDQHTALQALIETAQTQKSFIANLTELPKRPAPPVAAAQATRPDDWTSVLSLIGASMTDVHRVVLDTQIKIRETDRKIQDLQRKLAAVAPAPEERTEVKVFVEAGTALEADLTISYQVPGASWISLYDARLATGSKAVAPKLTLTRRAAIQQKTGEAWDNVRIALSTTRPTGSSAAPNLNPITVDFEPERRPPRPMAAAPPAPISRSEPVGGATAEAHRRGVRGRQDEANLLEVAQDAQEAKATLENAPFQAVFTTPGRLTIPNTGEAKRVFLQDEPLEPVLVVQTVPKLDAKAYLYAKLTMPRGAPYMPGAVSLFRDGTFVGTGRLPLLSPGQEHDLGFGVDDRITVRHVIVEEKRGETGLISSARTDQRNFRIAVKSRHERAVQLSVRDQIPASLNQDIKVELTGKSAPTRRDIEDKRGVIAWDSEIKPDEERIIEFGHRITWPAAKAIVYGR